MLLKILLFPFAVLYDLITRFRNYAFDKRWLKSTAFNLPLISVGNLSVGGTGKTPQVEYLIRLLQDDYRLGTLSRGYGRKTKGFILANEQSTARQIGDEPMQYYFKFGQNIAVSVGEERALAIPYLLDERPEIQTILLDDAFQHRMVRPSFSILMTRYDRPFYQDYLLPMGRLREARKGAKRANVIIVSKCPPDISLEERQKIQENMRPYILPSTPVFFSSIRYAPPLALNDAAQAQTLQPTTKILLISGIAQAEGLEQYIKTHFTMSKHMRFADHHFYIPPDMADIRKHFSQQKAQAILCTEKDAVKLQMPELKDLIADLPIFYLPIEVEFLADEANFQKIIRTQASGF